jgi:hypothetical protein
MRPFAVEKLVAEFGGKLRIEPQFVKGIRRGAVADEAALRRILHVTAGAYADPDNCMAAARDVIAQQSMRADLNAATRSGLQAIEHNVVLAPQAGKSHARELVACGQMALHVADDAPAILIHVLVR